MALNSKPPHDERIKAEGVATCYVYGLRELDSDIYFYVGSTKEKTSVRLREHLYQVQTGAHMNKHFTNKVKKIGTNNVACDVLQVTNAVNRWSDEKKWIDILISRGNKLVNRIHNDISFQFQSYREYRMPYERWLQVVEVASKPPKRTKPKFQKLANGHHEILKRMIIISLEQGVFPLPEWGISSDVAKSQASAIYK